MNKVIKALRDGMVQSVVSGELTTEIIPAGSDLLVAVPMGTSKFMLTSLDVTAQKDIEFYVEMFESTAKEKSFYNSGISQGRNYDLIDMIYIDAESLDQCYVSITNSSSYDAKFDISIRGYLMK